MRSAALVFGGGALGSLARYLLSLTLPALWSVFLVNTVGSFLLGLLLGSLRADQRAARLVLGTGFLGGFTTYSAFAIDSVTLASEAGHLTGLAVGASQVVLGLLAALVGFAVAEPRRGVAP